MSDKSVSQTLTQFLMQHQPPGSKGDFTLLMTAIQTAVKVVEKNIRRAGLHGNFGYVGDSQNSTGDDQVKLDVIANNAFKAHLISSERIYLLGSEEEDKAVLVDKDKRGSYMICFDPLDGSSNVDANVSVGSIWGIWKVPPSKEISTVDEATHALLQPGAALVSAGYAMYGSATNLVITTGQGVNGFTLDATIGEFLLTHPNMTCPKARSIYSVNEGNERLWQPWFRNYVQHLKFKTKKPYSSRYIGSMVADVHRTILYGGIFCYPDDAKSASGKLRYLYEAAPMAMLIEQAGGKASTGTGRILDVVPTKLHQRVPVFLGSRDEIDLCLSFRAGSQAKL
eukprot:CAMPEP_0176420360 /NCGR_PEP_ID=MMETSP0127-20121128/8564_1 /TAXON_ID=938130 /ORGANISM="Platyophrya macrostoma, Strain WH" /LENGTH=338 /DNA_ID=CAMNT_0017800949 /DNA_START=54 /DNA_END=1070 /DNA_ORIENTATION=-